MKFPDPNDNPFRGIVDHNPINYPDGICKNCGHRWGYDNHSFGGVSGTYSCNKEDNSCR